MNTNIYDLIQTTSSYLKLSISSQEVAHFCADAVLSDKEIESISSFLTFMKDL